MAKIAKVWRVLEKYEGRVTLETECKHVVLSNKLSQEELADIAKNPSAAAFMELVPASTQTDGE
ncbi:hypothetical protein [Dyadobacter sp. LHD-138]|uniref:hypothetical protein n=1 Tax=Dyadobacter sp. LHD-138 TaxID=3071413 RepID=UPI0027E1D382|nr:hypothetical protein [Dyadobacter sp. LHD-138]MDQ6479807.1 hypothetical protein [Dyadobacter sp. LHD-138]